MFKFTLLINEQEIAEQIANLLNSYNRLQIRHTAVTILTNPTQYFIEQNLVNEKRSVVGCVGLHHTSDNTSFIKHLCVHPNVRREGTAKKLLNTALKSVKTDIVYMNVRSDNYPSLKLAENAGFLTVTYKQKDNYYLLTLGREVNGN